MLKKLNRGDFMEKMCDECIEKKIEKDGPKMLTVKGTCACCGAKVDIKKKNPKWK